MPGLLSALRATTAAAAFTPACHLCHPPANPSTSAGHTVALTPHDAARLGHAPPAGLRGRKGGAAEGAGGVRAGRPFVLLEVRSVSLRLCMRAVGVDDVVRALATVLRRHRVTAANFVGHSFGTFVVAHMRKLFPETVSSVLLCDPVRRPRPSRPPLVPLVCR